MAMIGAGTDKAIGNTLQRENTGIKIHIDGIKYKQKSSYNWHIGFNKYDTWML